MAAKYDIYMLCIQTFKNTLTLKDGKVFMLKKLHSEWAEKCVPRSLLYCLLGWRESTTNRGDFQWQQIFVRPTVTKNYTELSQVNNFFQLKSFCWLQWYLWSF